jgi:hypothetical protein
MLPVRFFTVPDDVFVNQCARKILSVLQLVLSRSLYRTDANKERRFIEIFPCSVSTSLFSFLSINVTRSLLSLDESQHTLNSIRRA